MKLFFSFFCVIIILICFSCTMKSEKTKLVKKVVIKVVRTQPAIIVDCNYTFEEAIAGTKAPQSIIDNLELIAVTYYSVDRKLHRGQILANKKLTPYIKQMFGVILKRKFPIAHAIPVAKYNWNDEASMEANNT